MDLFGPSKYASLSDKYYAFVIVDILDTHLVFSIERFKMKRDMLFLVLEVTMVENFCNDFGIEHQYSSPRTPQQNGVVERKNMSIQEMARIILNENALPKYFWVQVINTTYYVLNRVLVSPHLNKTSYEL